MAHSDEAPLALLADSLAQWAGGIDFLRFCISALHSVSPETRWSVLLPNLSIRKSAVVHAKNAVKTIAGMRTSPIPRILRSELTDALASCPAQTNLVDYRNTIQGLAGALRKCRAQALFPCSISLGRSFPLPWIAYIPDLQHKRLPHFFSARERMARDRIFLRILEDAQVVVVNAAAVVQDIEEFYPRHKARLFSLPFCPPANSLSFDKDSASRVRQTYRLPSKYFMISNQFWVHKSHETAFMALRQVRDEGHDVDLVCTGNTQDYRWPDHFGNLQALIDRNNLQDHIHILGLIPKIDQLALMHQSIAVIQPTLFEGGPGGGAVYDAISINTPSIVSDIPVNREIDIGIVHFFEAGCVDDLATQMIANLNKPPVLPSQEEICARLSGRQREYGSLLLQIAAQVANGAFK